MIKCLSIVLILVCSQADAWWVCDNCGYYTECMDIWYCTRCGKMRPGYDKSNAFAISTQKN